MKPPKETRCVEGRGQLRRSPDEKAKGRTQSRTPLTANLARVNDAARRNRRTRFTALLHHLDVAALERAFRRLKRRAAAGVDGQTVDSYGAMLQANLMALHRRVQSGTYRPLPVRRVYIPKPDGGQRPLGVPALEDKIVQGAMAELLSALYETDFLGLSYGFRPGRGPHQALTALHTAIMSQNVNWVLDADIRRFFDSVDHEWMMRILEHRIGDPRVLALIRAWLKAGVMEAGEWKETEEGTPQGAGISPLLANVFLHYVVDLWVCKWRRYNARGKVSLVRYADDLVLGFQYEDDGKMMLRELGERLQKFSLQLHEGKTRLLEFGRLPTLRRAERGRPRCRAFAFLGFTHYCARTRDGRFVVKRKTQAQRLNAKLRVIGTETLQRRHEPIALQTKWLASLLRGHYAYYGLPSNFRALNAFRRAVVRLWYRALKKRSQRGLPWDAYAKLLDRYPLPTPTISHPSTPSRLQRVTPEKSRVRESRMLGSVRAKPNG